MGNLKKINKVLITTLILFSVGVFANYSKTSSKYFIDDLDTKGDNIANLITFKSLKYGDISGILNYQEKLTNLEISDIEYTLKFYRKIVGPKDTDVVTDNYRVVVDNGCTVQKVTTPKAPTYEPNPDGSINENSKGSMYKISKGSESETDNVVDITYVNDVESNTSEGKSSSELITVTYTCPLSVVKRDKKGGGEETSTMINIFEQVNDESEFLYLEYNYVKDFVQKVYAVLINGNKLEKMHIPVEDSQINFDDEFNKWIEAYGKKFSQDNPIFPTMQNLIKRYITDKNVKSNPNKGLGLKSGNSDAGAAYKIMYQFDTIASQAETYNVNIVSPTKPDLPQLYFIDNISATETTELFKRYLKDYYNYSDADITTIIDYVAEYGGISTVLGNSTKTIPGISHISAGVRYYVSVDSSILRQIEIRDKVIVAKNSSNIMSDFVNNFRSKNQTYNWITGSSGQINLYLADIRVSEALKESLLTTNENVNDYYFFRNGDSFICIRVYNHSDDLAHTYLEITRLNKVGSADVDPATEPLTITDPTRIMYSGYITADTIDSEKQAIDYISAVVALKTGQTIDTNYRNVATNAKTWLESGVDNSSVADYRKESTLFDIEYTPNPKLVNITRTTYAAQASETASTQSLDEPTIEVTE